MAKEWTGIVAEDGYDDDENRIYDEAMTAIKAAVDGGMGFDEACSAIKVENEELRKIIIDDYLKILVAEMHFNRGEALEEIAGPLKIPVARLEQAKAEMIKQVAEESVEVYRRSVESGESDGFGAIGGPETVGNA
ncbi:MAG: hypothetical protein HZA20_13245 [Nitrospirae bacterium]|nr:hypothetical protein [Nitrospirota bacterium]